MADGKVVIEADIETKSFDAQITSLERKLEELEKIYESGTVLGLEDDKEVLEKLQVEIEKTKNKIFQLKQAKFKQEMDLKPEVEESKKLDLNLGKIVKKVGKWALAVFGVRSAYTSIRQAMSTLSQYNEDLAKKIETIKLSMAVALEPIVNWLVDAVYKLLAYLNMILIAWFDIDILSRTNALNMQKASKSAKDMKKTLAGFDEINTVGGNQQNGTSGAVVPDISDIMNMETPKWVQDIIDNKDGILVVLGLIVGALASVYFGLQAITGLGIGLIIAGAILLIQGILDYINDPSWENFGTILEGIGLLIAGIAVLFGGWIVALVGVGVAIVGYLIKNWDKVKEKLKEVGAFFKRIWDGAKDSFKYAFKQMADWFKNTAVPLFSKIFKGIGNAFITVINAIISAINFFLTPFRAVITGIGSILGKSWTMNDIKIPKISYLATGGIVNLPSRGVPVGGAYAGERGAEGVIPLTDSQQMALLGEAIGKYVSIQNVIDVSMDSRKINRILQQSNNRQSIMMNR